jgi:hypothetical protein
VLRFFEMEGDAPEQHIALADARALVPQTSEFRAFETRIVARVRDFIAIHYPRRGDAQFLASLFFTVMTATGERIATRRLPRREVARIARTTARMLCDLL